jgi:hypothetical protein
MPLGDLRESVAPDPGAPPFLGPPGGNVVEVPDLGPDGAVVAAELPNDLPARRPPVGVLGGPAEGLPAA